MTSRDYDYNFALADQMIHWAPEEDQDLLILILQDYINLHSNDPYQAFYLIKIAHYYQTIGAQDVARYYLERLLHNAEDLILEDQSVHLSALNELLKISQTEEERIPIYEQLITRFPDRINLGQCHYYLGRGYERLGQWDRAYQEYDNFLEYPGTEIPGLVNGYNLIAQRIRFHESSKNWTFETLDDLVNAIRYAIGSRKIYLLNNYRAQDFFVLSWSQKMLDQQHNSGMGDFTSYSQSVIYYNRELESFSNDQEAYLKTWGWSYRVKSWYLYFRRIDYPRDPEIHGRWEWAGIFLGDPL